MDALTPSQADTAADAQAPPKSFGVRNEQALIGTISMLIFLAFWEAAVALEWVNPLFISPPPASCARAMRCSPTAASIRTWR